MYIHNSVQYLTINIQNTFGIQLSLFLKDLMISPGKVFFRGNFHNLFTFTFFTNSLYLTLLQMVQKALKRRSSNASFMCNSAVFSKVHSVNASIEIIN